MTFRDTTPDYLQILGHNRFVNSVLAEHLSLQLGYECRVQNGLDFDLVAPDLETEESNVTLIDVTSYTMERVSELLNTCAISKHVHSVGLLHLLEDKEAESLVFYSKVRGLFYQGSSRAHIARGVEQLIGNGYWVPRRLLERMLESNRRTPGIKAEVTIHSLTRREREILKMATTGATNKQIAESLGVRAHTVKTHIYNLFKKLGASNRVQATTWAKTHASELLL